MSKRGLPESVRMRHDAHYVETLTASAGDPIGRMLLMHDSCSVITTWFAATSTARLSSLPRLQNSNQLTAFPPNSAI